MKILHYSLGFPPYRTGGLTKYCTDLMLEQKTQGMNVSLLWPGKMGIFNKRVRIEKKDSWKSIESFELINPLPVPLDEGIIDVDLFIKSTDGSVYVNFLRELEPDIIHIHTLMGLHSEFLYAAKKLKIRTVFTSHDYFGLCPKVTLFHDGAVCDNDHNCEDCVKCNVGALSIKKITMLQSPVYRELKNTPLITRLRKRHRQEFFEGSFQSDVALCNNDKKAKEYQKLRHYYVSMLEQVDCIHYNSSVAQKVYEKYIHPKDSKIVPITHSDIQDKRQVEKTISEKLRIIYLGPTKPYKGFQLLKSSLDELWEAGIQSFELNIINIIDNPSVYMNMREGYQYGELEKLFANSDILIAPSIWYETFGFTVLEAMSYGTPVIVSNNVGAKDLIKNGEGIVIGATKESIKDAVLYLLDNRLLCKKLRSNIIQHFRFPHLDDVEVLY